ncbi:MAG: cob(I)yrinic acid a,c-diamide adenosyltransferase [Zoogloeaceae bacterium]|nr:cob(I)yrinic acid a,c-diamide adenosyltransferase [Zoogloeaceae bacterium]
MGNRLSKIMTRTGDTGSTGLGDGSRTHKNSLRIHAIGEVDELNATLGVLLAEPLLPETTRALLITLQHDLFDLGGELCIPSARLLSDTHVERLEAAAETMNAGLPRLKEFILPGGSRPAALAHVARAVCRRAERALVTLGAAETISDTSRRYLNRLSDLLFILARHLNQANGVADVLWRSGVQKEKAG